MLAAPTDSDTDPLTVAEMLQAADESAHAESIQRARLREEGGERERDMLCEVAYVSLV